jgi:hypothetical protein
MSSIDDLYKLVVADLDEKKRARSEAENMQVAFNERFEFLYGSLAGIMEPLLKERFDSLPIAGISKNSGSIDIYTVGGNRVNLPSFTLSIGLKSVQFTPKYDADTKQIEYHAGLKAGYFRTHDTHQWVIQRSDFWLLAADTLGEYLIEVFKEA